MAVFCWHVLRFLLLLLLSMRGVHLLHVRLVLAHVMLWEVLLRLGVLSLLLQTRLGEHGHREHACMLA